MGEFTGIITLTQINDGQSGQLYFIRTDTNIITRSWLGDQAQFSPSSLNFQLIDKIGTNHSSEGIMPKISLLEEEWKEIYPENEAVSQELESTDDLENTNETPLLKVIEFSAEKQQYECYIGNFLNGEDKTEAKALKIQFIIDNNLYEAVFPFQDAISTNIFPTFSIGANGIVQAYGANKLVFNDEGLTVNEGGLTVKSCGLQIQNSKGEKVLSADKEGNLIVSGTIDANQGHIGNIEIINGELVGKDEGFKISNDGIVANNIVLKTGAQIEEFIKLGESYLYNPNNRQDRAVLISGGITINDKGVITINGEGVISGGSKGGSNWKIDGKGIARFKDIYADQVHLQNTVLEIGTIQSVGSTMIFKDSAVINKVEGKTFYLDDTSFPFKSNVDQWVLVNNKYYKITRGSNNDYKMTDESFQPSVGMIVVYLGTPEDDFILSALGHSADSSVSYAHKNSITLSDFSKVGDTINFTKKLVLGDLSGLNLGNAPVNGFGLYAENVFLKGSLTTKVPPNSEQAVYAGINTLSSISAYWENKDGNIEDVGYIVFWSGAKSIKEIDGATFYVTDKGNLFANNAKIVNSVFAGTIDATEIKTATITGAEGLKIRDTSKGIVFEREDENGFQPTLKIGSMGLYAKNKEIPFISVENDVEITAKKIAIDRIYNANQLEIDAVKTQINGNFALLKEKIKMEYQQKNNGYDLFISEQKGVV